MAKIRMHVERTLKFIDSVVVELPHIDDESKDDEVKRIVSERDIKEQTLAWEEIDIFDAEYVDS